MKWNGMHLCLMCLGLSRGVYCTRTALKEMAHNIRGGCLWSGSRSLTFLPLFYYILLMLVLNLLRFLPFCILSESGYALILKHSKGWDLIEYLQTKLLLLIYFSNAWASVVTEAGYHISGKRSCPVPGPGYLSLCAGSWTDAESPVELPAPGSYRSSATVSSSSMDPVLVVIFPDGPLCQHSCCIASLQPPAELLDKHPALCKGCFCSVWLHPWLLYIDLLQSKTQDPVSFQGNPELQLVRLQGLPFGQQTQRLLHQLLQWSGWWFGKVKECCNLYVQDLLVRGFDRKGRLEYIALYIQSKAAQ